jgi:hypothetical protein
LLDPFNTPFECGVGNTIWNNDPRVACGVNLHLGGGSGKTKDDLPPLADRITDGSVTAYGGPEQGEVVVDTNEATGLQIIKGVHRLHPIPEDGAFLTPGTVTLSWTVPAGTKVDVWFDTSDDLSAAQQPVAMEPKKSVDVEVDPKTPLMYRCSWMRCGVGVVPIGKNQSPSNPRSKMVCSSDMITK